MKTRLLVLLLLGGAALLLCQTSFATMLWTFPLTSQVVNGITYGYSATADVTIGSGTLTVRVANTSPKSIKPDLTYYPTDPTQCLGGFWMQFDGFSASSLTPVSALAHNVRDFRNGGTGTAPDYYYNNNSSFQNVAGEWFLSNGTYPPSSAMSYGVGAAGYGYFSNTQFASGPNLNGNAPGADGRDGTILPGNFQLPAPYSGLMADGSVYSWDYVDFAWTYTGALSPDNITGTWFQFGTNDLDVNGPGGNGHHQENDVPEPASMALLALAIGSMGAALKRRKK